MVEFNAMYTVITVDEGLFLDQWRWGDRKRYYLNNMQFEKVIMLNEDMTAVRINLEAVAIRSVLGEEKRREDPDDENKKEGKGREEEGRREERVNLWIRKVSIYLN